MERLKQFFSCCGKDNKEDELQVTMKRRKNNQAPTSNRQTFIKRSIGKNPILDLSFKKDTPPSLLTLGGTSTTRTKHLKDRDRSINTFNQMSMSFDNHQNSLLISTQNNRVPVLLEKRKEKVMKFVDYENYSYPKKGKENLNIEQEQVSAFEPLKENINIEQEHVSGFNPLKENINSNAAVLRKQKYSKDLVQKQKMNENMNISNVNYYRKSGLDTIEQRSSIPSIDDNQIHQIRQISSKATLKLSNFMDKNICLLNPASTEYYRSLTLAANRQFNMTQFLKSERLQKNQAQKRQDLDKIIMPKLYMDIKMLQRQLMSLQQEQLSLVQQKLFTKENKQKDLLILSNLRQNYTHNILSRQKQIKQIRKLLNNKQKILL